MTDLDIAILILKAAADADGGCNFCAREVLDKARHLQPHLPWDIAIDGLNKDSSDAYSWAKTDPRGVR